MILITGASGFLGGFLVDEFLNHGYAVRAMARPESDTSHIETTKAQIAYADLSNLTQLENALCGVEEVIHAAALLGIGRGRKREDFLKINYEATKNLADLCVKQGIKRITFISSIAALGPNFNRTGFLDENSEPNPISFYGQSKLEAEKYLLQLAKEKKIEVVIIRPALIYGPRDKRCAVNYFRIARLGFFPIPMPANNKASFIYATDAAKAIFLAHTKSAPNEIYMLANDVVTFKEFGEKLLSTKDKRRRGVLIYIPRFLINGLALVVKFLDFIMAMTRGERSNIMISGKIKSIGCGNWAVDNSKITKTLGFVPNINLTQGLKNTWEFYCADKKLLSIKRLVNEFFKK